MSYSSYAGLSSQSTQPAFSQSTLGGSSQPYASQRGPMSGNINFGPPASMSKILLEPLARLQTLSQTLFLSLAPPQTRPPPPPSVADLVTVDAQLAAAVQLARIHQVKQRRIEQLKDEVLALDRRWRSIVGELDDGRRELDAIVREGEERIKAIEEAKAAAIPYPELLAYAQSLSAFTSAPPNMPSLAPGQPPPPLFFPPFPNEERMRRGHMNDEAPLGILGETHSVGKAPTVSPQVELPAHLAANPYRPDFRPPQQQPFFDLDLDLNPDL
ncbi:vitamin-D-receptor interacting mediator subunit 4-domain-containing protein [Trametes gibbosa]|nr:vitamin-D-receptor interacting mediator subunit 4-domain-containing protein [Trametes gibbosa]